MNKSKFFEYELNLISDLKLREYAEKLIETFPDYFFEVPASSTGKYHPAYTLGNGGLYRHTRAVVGILENLFNLEQFPFTDREKMLLIIGAISHDSLKSGKVKSQYTVKDHPQLAAQNIREFNSTNDYQLSESDLNFLCSAIESHMGQWGNPKPLTESEKMLHLADYLASRKNLEFLFPANDEAVKASSEVPSDLVLPFGKYQGKLISEVVASNRGYAQWMSENMKEPYRSIANKLLNHTIETNKN